MTLPSSSPSLREGWVGGVRAVADSWISHCQKRRKRKSFNIVHQKDFSPHFSQLRPPSTPNPPTPPVLQDLLLSCSAFEPRPFLLGGGEMYRSFDTNNLDWNYCLLPMLSAPALILHYISAAWYALMSSIAIENRLSLCKKVSSCMTQDKNRKKKVIFIEIHWI